MAKWGEGDPRWLVEDRGDGVNVNGWHWEEKDRMAWTRQRIGELLTGLAVSTSPMVAEITVRKVEKVEGEAAVSQRKGTKKLAVYDLSLELEWVARPSAGDGKEVAGRMKITEFASHSDEDDYIIECTKCLGKSDSSDSDWDTWSRLARSKLQPAIIAALKTYANDLLGTYELT